MPASEPELLPIPALEEGSFRLVSEDHDLLFLYKPSGMPVFPYHDGRDAPSVLSCLLSLDPAQAAPPWPAGFEGGIVHRLDTGTSGLLLAARSLDALHRVRGMFLEKQLVKHYCFISHHEVAWDAHELRTPIAHDRRRKDRMVLKRGATTEHRGSWYPAWTVFRRLRGHLWSAAIHTGVTHQIRLHAAGAGIPLTGDRLYGGAHWTEPLMPPDGVTFCLHHLGLEGPGLRSPRVGAPAWWRDLGFQGAL